MLTDEDKYNLLTGRVPLLLNRLLVYNFRQQGIELTREQWSILAILWKQDGCSQQVLADLTYRDKPSTTRLIDNLEKDGYVIRQPHKTDRRQNLIFLTDKGLSMEDPILDVLALTVAQSTEGLTDEQIRTIRLVFDKLYLNIQQNIHKSI